MGATYQPPQWLVPNMGPGNVNKVGNYSFQFDGSLDFINCGNPTNLQITGNLSISAWVKFDALATYWFVAKDDNGVGAGRSYMLNLITGSNKIRFAIERSGLKSVLSTTTIVIDTWYHVVGVNDGTDLKVYINGALDNTTAGDGGSIDNGTSDFILGGKDSIGNFLNGELSEVSVFDYALELSDVQNLYGNATDGVGNPMGFASPPVAYYKGDRAGFGDQWALPNQVNYDQVLDFGASDYINLSNAEQFQITGAITLSMWVKMDAAGDQGFMTKSQTPYFGGSTTKFFNIGVLNPDIHWQVGNGTSAASANINFSSYMDGNWHHVVGTFDGTTDPDNIRLYIDGVYVDSGSAAFDTIKGDSIYPLYISDPTGTYDSGMEMSNAQIWDSNLTDGSVAVGVVAGGEIATLYNNGTPFMGTQPQVANLQGWWKLNQSTSAWNGTSWDFQNSAT